MWKSTSVADTNQLLRRALGILMTQSNILHISPEDIIILVVISHVDGKSRFMEVGNQSFESPEKNAFFLILSK